MAEPGDRSNGEAAVVTLTIWAVACCLAVGSLVGCAGTRGATAIGLPTEPAQPQPGDRRWTFASIPVHYDAARRPQMHLATVDARTSEDAWALVEPVLEEGPGAAVPASVIISGYVEFLFEGPDVVLRSSVTGTFETFRFQVGDEVLSDLERGLNVELSRAGNGWSTLIAAIPVQRLARGAVVRLEQLRAGDGAPLTASLTF
jgi:hypothetical protein